MSNPTGDPSGAWNACTKIVEAATKSCASPAGSALTPAQDNAPNWDAMANSFASLSTALTWGSLMLGLVGILGGLAWGRIVAMRAENEARTEAEKTAQKLISQWLADDAPQIIRAHIDNLNDTTLGSGDDDAAADAMGEGAG